MSDDTNSLLQDPNWLQSIGQEIPGTSDAPEDTAQLSLEERLARTSGGMLPPKPTSLVGEIGKGIAAGARDLYGTAGGLVGLAGDALGNQDVKNFGLGIYQDQQEANQQNNAPAVSSIGEATKSFGNFADYAAYNLSKGLTEMVPMLAAGGVGGEIAGSLAEGAVQKAVQYGVEKGLSQEAAEAAVAASVRQGGAEKAAQSFSEALAPTMGEDAASKFGEEAFKAQSAKNTASFLGAQAGNAATIIPQSVGDEYGQTKDAETALGYGTASGALNAVAMGIVAAPAFRSMLGIGTEAAAKSSFLKSAATRIGTDTALMVGLAYPSTYLNQEAQASVDPSFDINSPEAQKQRMESVAGGALQGAAFGGLGSLEFLHNTAPLTADALQKITFTSKGEQPALTPEKLPDNATPHTVSPEVTITDPRTGESIKAQKNNTVGKWTINHPDGSMTILNTEDPNNTHAATLELLAQEELDKLNNKSEEDNNESSESEKLPVATTSELPADTSEFYPASFPTASGQAFAGQPAEESTAEPVSSTETPTEKQKFAEAGQVLGQLAANKQDTRTEFPVGTITESTRDPNLLSSALQKVTGIDLGSQVSEKKAQADAAVAASKTPENFTQNLQVGDPVSFDHPELGKVDAVVTQAETPSEHGLPEADSIKVQYNNPVTGRKKTQVIPRSSWSRIEAPKPEVPTTDEIVNTALGDNPTPQKLQQSGMSNIRVEGDQQSPTAVSGDIVLKDGLLPFNENKNRENDPIHALLDEAGKTGDYSKVVATGALPARYESKSKKTHGIWTGGELSSADRIALRNAEDGVTDGGRSASKAQEIKNRLEKVKETTVRQMNQGLRVLAPKGSIAPPGFEFTKLPNGLMQVTAVHDYLGTSWRMRGALDPVMTKANGHPTYFPGKPDTFSVDVPVGIKGKYSQKRGPDILTTRFNTPGLRAERSDIAREGHITRRENQENSENSEIQKNPLNHTESQLLNTVAGRALEHIDNSTFRDSVKEEAKSGVVPRLARDIRKSGRKAPEPKNDTQKSLTSMLFSNIARIARAKIEGASDKADEAVVRAEQRGVGRAGKSEKGEKGVPLMRKVNGSVQEDDLATAKNLSSGLLEKGIKVQDSDYTSEGLRKIEQHFKDTLNKGAEETDYTTKQLMGMEALLEKIKNRTFNRDDFRSAVEQKLIDAPKSYTVARGDVESSIAGKTIPGSSGTPGGGTLSGSDASKIEERIRNNAGRKLTDKEYSQAVQSTLEQAKQRQMKLTKADKTHLTSVMEYHKVAAPRLSENNVYAASKQALLKANEKTKTAGARSRTFLSIDDPNTGLSDLHDEGDTRIEGDNFSEQTTDTQPKPVSDANQGDTVLKSLSDLPDGVGSDTHPAFQGLPKASSDFIDKVGMDALELHEALIASNKKSNLTKAQRNTWNKIKKEIYDNETNRRNGGARGSDVQVGEGSTPVSGDGESTSDGLESPARSSENEATAGGSVGSGGSTEDTAGSVSASDATAPRGFSLGASPEQSRALSAAVKSRLVQSAGRLSDAEIAKMSPEEIDKAHTALTTQADSSSAHANERIESAAPRVEDVVNKTLGELVAGAREESIRRTPAERAQIIRKNYADLIRSGAFRSPAEFLTRVASGKLEGVPSDLALVARTMLSGTKVDWNKVATQIGRFTDKTSPTGEAPWSGLATKQGKGHNVALNLNAQADRGIIGTYIHELLHTVERDKITGKTKLNPTESKALDEIKSAYKAFLDRAGIAGTPAEIEAKAREMSQGKGENDYGYTFLRSPEEFVRGIQESPDLHALGQSLGLDYGDGKGPLKGTARKVYGALTELVSGRKADQNSPLVRAFSSAFDLTHSNPRENKASPLHAEMKGYERRESWIRDQIEQRNLRGTTNDRTALIKEWNSKEGIKDVEPAKENSSGETSPKETPTPTDTKKPDEEEPPAPPAGSDKGPEPEPPTPEPPKPKRGRPKKESTPVERKQVAEIAPAPEPPRVEQKTEKPAVQAKNEEEPGETYSQADLQRLAATASYEEWKKAAQSDASEWGGAPTKEAYSAMKKVGARMLAGKETPLESPARESLGESMLRLGREKGQDMFRLPQELSKSDDLTEVLNSTGSKFSSFDAYGMKLISETPIKGDMVLFPATDGKRNDGYSDGKVIKAENGVLTIRPTDKSPDFQLPETQAVAAKGSVRLYDDSVPHSEKDSLTIDSSDGANGTIRKASSIYQAIYQWAHNTGQKVVPDTTTSWAGHFRRNAQQISSAIRNQDAEHFRPTIDQRSRMFPNLDKDGSLRKWESLDTAGKVSALMRAEKSYIEQAAPELVSHSYDPATGNFTDENGASVSIHDIRSRITEGLAETKNDGTPDPFRVGEASLRRYLGATRPALENADGLTAYSADNSGHLDKALYSEERPSVVRDTLRKVGSIIPEGAKETLFGKDISSYNGVKTRLAGLFTGPDKGVNKNVSFSHQVAQGIKLKAENHIKYANRLWSEALKNDYGNKISEAQLLEARTALGNYGNPLTDLDVKRVNEEQAKNGSEAAIKLARELTQKNRETYRDEQQKALDSLPPRARAAIVSFRDGIDSLQQELIRQGVVSGDLKATLEENHGIYITRSYDHLDAGLTHDDMVKKNPELARRMETSTRNFLAKERAPEILNENRKAGGTMTKEEALQVAKDQVTEEEVHDSLNRLLNPRENSLDRRFTIGQFPGQKDLSTFLKRGNLEDDLKQYLGERKDPATIAADTMGRQAAVLANHKFLSDLRESGLKDGSLYDPADPKNKGRSIPHKYVPIASINNESLAPLNGLFIQKEIGDGLLRMLPRMGASDTPWLLDLFKKVTGYSMGAKTQFSPAAQVRHNVSNLLGLVTTANWHGGLVPKNLKEAYGKINPFSSLEDARNNLPEIQRLTELGLLHQSEANRLLHELIDGNENGKQTPLGDFLRKIASPLNKIGDTDIRGVKLKHLPETLYGVSDAAYKVAIFYGERQKYANAHPEWTPEQVDQKAAQIALDCHWSYDRSPAIVKELSKVPIVAPFVRFSSEVYRTSYNLLKLAHDEIKEGNATGNAELTKMGWDRMRGIATVALGPSALIAMTQAASGMTDEDQEALRKFLPEWQKNAQIIPFQKADGKVGYFDLSWWDHYKILRTPIKAVIRAFSNDEGDFGKGLHDAMIDGMGELFQPFDKEQLTTSAIMDIARNKNSANGAPLYNPQDSAANIGLAVTNRLWTALSPGAIDSINRIYKGATGYVSDSGRSYDAGQEIANMVGWRAADMNLANSLHFTGSQFMQQSANASQLLSHAATSIGSRTEPQVTQGYKQANEAHQALVQDLRTKYEAAIQLGMSPEQIQTALKGARVSQDVIDQVTSATYKRFQPSAASIKLLQSRGQDDRVQWLQNAINATPETVNLNLGH